jgi:DNA (cytosine-5)-methyltransferase 3A
VFVDILNHVKTLNRNVTFLLENVRMKQEYSDVISYYLGVKPVLINSNLVSAQNRLRLYWTNIPNLGQPENKGILLKDILEAEVDKKYYIDGGRLKWLQSPSGKKSIDIGFTTLNPEKAACLTARGEPSWNCNYIDPYNQKYIKGYAQHDVSGKEHDSQAMGAYYPDKKHGALAASNNGDKSKVLLDKSEVIIRKLTPVECERLQTVPDNYTQSVRDSQRYKMLGNGWTIDVISYLLRHITTGG